MDRNVKIFFLIISSTLFCKSSYHEIKYELMKATEENRYKVYSEKFKILIQTENDESIRPNTYEYFKKYSLYSIDREILLNLIKAKKETEFLAYLEDLEKKDKDEYLACIYLTIKDLLTTPGITEQKRNIFLTHILNRKINPNIKFFDKSPIELAATIQNVEILKLFKKYSENLSISVDRTGNVSINNAIFYASSNTLNLDLKNRRETIIYLLENGINKNQIDNKGNSILMRSIVGCDINLIKYLIKKGINPSIKNHDGENLYSADWDSLVTMEQRLIGDDKYENDFKLEYPRRCNEVRKYLSTFTK